MSVINFSRNIIIVVVSKLNFLCQERVFYVSEPSYCARKVHMSGLINRLERFLSV